MFHSSLSNSTSLSEEVSGSSSTKVHHHQDFSSLSPMFSSPLSPQDHQLLPETLKLKKKRNLPGNPDPDSEVIALSPKTLMATNRFVCEICNKGFQRDQNLQLHRRGHNLPWKLRQRSTKDIKKRVYVCPELSCVHHHPSRALGDLTGIKKHFCRKHGEKKWKCEKCSKKYAVQSDWKAHSKTCGTREYRCDCGTLFSRKDSFITHRAFCDALAEESARLSSAVNPLTPTPTQTNSITINNNNHHHHHPSSEELPLHLHSTSATQNNPSTLFHASLFTPQHHHHHQNFLWNPNSDSTNPLHQIKSEMTHPHHHHHQMNIPNPNSTTNTTTSMSSYLLTPPDFLEAPPPTVLPMTNANMNTAHMSATALLQKAANVGASSGLMSGAGAGGGGGSSSNTQTQSVGHHIMGSGMTRLQMNEFVSVSQFSSGGGGLGMGSFNSSTLAAWQKNDRLTRDFLGLAAGDSVSTATAAAGGGGTSSGCGGTNNNTHDHHHHQHHQGGGGGGSLNPNNVNVSVTVRDLLSYTGGVEFSNYDRDHSLLKTSGFGFAETWGDC